MFCYELEPTFEEVSRQLKPHGIKMAKVNIESEKKLKTRFDIQSLPYILTFKKGLSFKYDGPMGRAGAEGINVNYIQYMSITCHHTVTVITLVRYNNYSLTTVVFN